MVDDTSRFERRRVLQGIGAASVVGVAGCLGGDDEGDPTEDGDADGGAGDDAETDDGGDEDEPFYPHTIWGMYGSWEDAYVQGGEYYARDHGFRFENYNTRGEEEEQISHIQSFVQQDADGIVVGPVSETAPAGAVENAAAEGIPVVAANSEIETPELTMSVYVGNEQACEEVATEIVDNIDGEGGVINLQGDLGQSIGQEREQGFRNAVEDEDGIEVFEVSAEFNRQPAQEDTYSTLQAQDGEIDAIFAANGEMAAGAAEALDRYGLEPGDVFMGAMDGSPTVLELFEEGWLQRAYSQPTQYYLPIAMHYLEVARTDGEDALPDVGDEVTTDDIEISGEEHLGTDIWAGQDWAPATVEERHDHRWFRTSGALLDEENYDDESNWGVIFGDEAV